MRRIAILAEGLFEWHAMIFSHKMGALTIEGYEHCPLPSLNRLIEINEEAVSWLRPERSSKVVALSLITHPLAEQAAHDAIKRVEDETGLPATDVVRFGAGVLMNALHGFAWARFIAPVRWAA